MQLGNGCFLCIKTHYSLYLHPPFSLSLSLSCSSPPRLSPRKLKLSETLQNESLKALEWPSVCSQVAAFASTSMGSAAARAGALPLGHTPKESRKLLDQTTAATLLPRPLDLSGIEDISGIAKASVSGQWVSIGGLCAVRRTLRAARGVMEQLEKVALEEQFPERFSPLVDILENCNFLMDLEGKIGFCIDCRFSRIYDRASEKLEKIRSKRKLNMESLESLLKRVSDQIFQAGGIDKPLMTKRRSRMCVGIRASHKSLLPDGIVLNASGSGATYFIEPKEAVELNNAEVRLSDSERAEELVILSLLTAEVAKYEVEINYLLDRIMAVDLACARAAHAKWISGVCPVFCSESCGDFDFTDTTYSSLLDIEGIQHPLLLQPYLRNLLDTGNNLMESGNSSGFPNSPVPIDFKIGCRTKVIVISGPNTGGKTASMKTLGLACLMLKAGMYLAARKCPKIPWFSLILADIGDHQSLEKNLSTFSGHISRICQILEVASEQSLVLIDEIGSGTDPSEGVALSASILHYLKDIVKLVVVTSHYADLTRLKEEDARFDNAAMEFSLETLQPTYQMLWGTTGDSNALSIAESIGFSKKIIERAKIWVEKLRPDKQEIRKNWVYESLMQERDRLENQAKVAASLHAEVVALCKEIKCGTEDLEGRELALKAKENERIHAEIEAVKSEMESVIHDFENRIRAASSDQFNMLIGNAECEIASIVETHCPRGAVFVGEGNINSYIPQVGEQVQVRGLGDKLATVVETECNDNCVLVQYKKMRIRVNKKNINAIGRSAASPLLSNFKKQDSKSRHSDETLENIERQNASYGPLVQTTKNTVDLCGMRLQEASHHLNVAVSMSKPYSVIFVIHGVGTGVVMERALEILRNHPRVVKFEPESSMNYGCTVAYVK